MSKRVTVDYSSIDNNTQCERQTVITLTVGTFGTIHHAHDTVRNIRHELKVRGFNVENFGVVADGIPVGPFQVLG